MSPPEWFQPVPGEIGHYVAVLQSLSGERDALSHATQETWEHLTPIIELLGPKKREVDPFKATRVNGWVKRVADVVGGRPCFLDVLRMPQSHAVATRDGDRPVLSAIYAEARARGMAFVPVLRLGDSRGTVGQITECAGTDGRGVGLRYQVLGAATVDGRGPAALIKSALDSVQVDFPGADLLMDLGFLSDDIVIEPEFFVSAIDELMSIGPWRSTVLIGSSMPSSLGGGVVPEGTVGRLPRREWDLWQALIALRPSRLPTFGDYAVQNPIPPLEGQPSGPGQRANIRYTTDDVTLVPRAVGSVIQEGAEQYRQLCRILVAQPEFAGREFSWGDAVIAECADGFGEAGWQNTWRGAGTSHHISEVVSQLARMN
jgi:hypothetical protein